MSLISEQVWNLRERAKLHSNNSRDYHVLNHAANTIEELSAKIEDIALCGKSNITFIIGSSFGLSDEIKKMSDFKFSMSKMTFPHKLARIMLTEQIYRAFSISNNAKYHK